MPRQTSRNHLFNHGATIRELVDRFREQTREALRDLDDSRIRATGDNDLLAELEKDAILEVPVLQRDGIEALPPTEVDVDVSHDRSRDFREPGPHYVKGTAYTIRVPYAGNGYLFGFGTSPYNITPQGVVEDDAVLLTHEGLDLDPDSVRRDLLERLERIEIMLNTTRVIRTG